MLNDFNSKKNCTVMQKKKFGQNIDFIGFFEGFHGPSRSRTGNRAAMMEIVTVKWKRIYRAVSVTVSALQKFTVFQ
jgi:hypothetical protein